MPVTPPGLDPVVRVEARRLRSNVPQSHGGHPSAARFAIVVHHRRAAVRQSQRRL